jgi:hypothetical protein
MTTGYCTVDDVRRVFQEADLSGALAESNNQLVVDTIAAVSATVEKATKRHWYDAGGVSGDDQNVIPTDAQPRDDEYDLPSQGAVAFGAAGTNRRTRESRTVFSAGSSTPDIKERIRVGTGDLGDETVPTYARITLARKDVSSLDELLVINANGAVEDWVASSDYDTGVGLPNRGADAWVRLNNGGISELNIDVHALDDDIPSLANAVYATVSYGKGEVPQRIRRGVAHLAAADLVLNDEFVTVIPDDGQLTSLETKAERWGRTGVQKLGQDVVDESILKPYREGA